MRFVDRKAFPPPSFIQSPEWEELGRVLAGVHDSARGGRRGQQAAAGFEELFAPFREEATAALRPVFGGKCAYTEEPPNPELEPMFHLHRPGGDAIGLQGETSPEHYWWLQTRWTNWMLAAPETVSIKGTNFPVVGERMAVAGAEEETALLVDPCAEEPAWWLAFDEKGAAAPRRIASDALNAAYVGFDRGEFNIRLLDLNRPRLRDGRREAVRAASPRQFEQVLRAGRPEEVEAWLERAAAPDRPFLGALRQRLAGVLVANLELLSTDLQTEQARLAARRLAGETAAALCADLDRVATLRERMGQPRFEHLLEPVLAAALEACPDLEDAFGSVGTMVAGALPEEAPPVEDAAEPAAPPAAPAPAPASRTAPPPAVQPETTIDRAARLRRIRIRNFKAIEDLTITIPEGVEQIRVGPLHDQRQRLSAVNWKMLLGENACGKSSILQALALALFGPEVEVAPPLAVEKARRRGIGARHSFVELSFRGHERPVRLKLNRRGFKYAWQPRFNLFVRAYGATRLFRSDPDHWDASDATQRVRVGNLFDPFYPVIDVNSWLMGLAEGDFNVAARAIRELIAGVSEHPDPDLATVELVRDPERGTVSLGGDPLDELCDGYRTLLALTCDIMAGLGRGLSDMENAVGIVLIDEIGAHLHPRLRMQVVARLRYIFPQIQFICSTHEPLCLRGLFDREVDRIRRTGGVVSQETIDRSPSGYRIDQLLTSEFFGLESTIDPEIDGEFQRYYHLLSRSDLTEAQARERERLRNRLITEGVLGYTRRDQLVYEAIDSYLADRRTKSAGLGEAEAARLKQETIDKVKEIWSFAELRARSRGGGGD